MMLLNKTSISILITQMLMGITIPSNQIDSTNSFYVNGNREISRITLERTENYPFTTNSGEWVIRSDIDWKGVNPKAKSKGTEFYNFNNEMLIGVTMGMFASGGFSIEIDSVFIDINQIYVYYSQVKPLLGQVVPSVFTYPSFWIKLKKYDSEVVFIRTN